MFGIATEEFLLIAVVAIIVIGPKDLPLALRTAGRWIAKVRRVSNHFRSGIETMIREAEMEEMERKWREQNAAIMATTPAGGPTTIAGGDHGQTEHAPIDPLIAAQAPTEPVLPHAPVADHVPAHTPGDHAP